MFWKGGCFGSTTLGEKGQVVIPAEARRKLGLRKGDKLLVFGRDEHGVLVLVEANRVSAWVSRTLEELTELSAALGGGPAGRRRRQG